MTDYHEPPDELAPAARDLHRALSSLEEEIEAVDWCDQRVGLAEDPSLREVLAHNRDEEIEHARMTLEWQRRSVDSRSAAQTVVGRAVSNAATEAQTAPAAPSPRGARLP